MAPKTLVVCCDGTWNTPRTETNIFRTYQFLRGRLANASEASRGNGVLTCAGQAQDGADVALFYDAGVGTTNWLTRIAEGATGAGLSDNVRDAYHFLGHEYTSGANIYVFGFSRGAYTARSLCGFIKKAGLLKSPSRIDVDRAYLNRYATEPGVAQRQPGWSFSDVKTWKNLLTQSIGDLAGKVAGPDLATLPMHTDVKIRFVGVYDTVGALGIPLPRVEKVNDAIVGFHDTSISSLVEHAVHALAVDEKRGPYVPALWTLGSGGALALGQTVLQVWFPGVHSDIGGGYPAAPGGPGKGIGDITLNFMLRQAANRGLMQEPTQPTPPLTLVELPDQHESLNETWQILSRRLKILPDGERSIGPTAAVHGEDLRVAGDVYLHESLTRRFDRRVGVIREDGKGERRDEQLYASPLVPNVKKDSLPEFREA